MADDKEQRPESLLPYDEWMEAGDAPGGGAARSPMSRRTGCPAEHHFYITFRTDHPGVVMPPRLRAQYPQEMTIVLQHQFWDLKMDDEAGLISVGLSFGGVPASLVDSARRGDRIRRPSCALRPAVPRRCRRSQEAARA